MLSSARRLETKPMPFAMASAGSAGSTRSPSRRMRPRCKREMAIDGPPDGMMAGAAQADQSERFAGATLKTHRADALRDGAC